jgi:hypothetical protein
LKRLLAGCPSGEGKIACWNSYSSSIASLVLFCFKLCYQSELLSLGFEKDADLICPVCIGLARRMYKQIECLCLDPFINSSFTQKAFFPAIKSNVWAFPQCPLE